MALEFFQHYFSEMGHRDLLVTQNLSQAHRATNAPLPHAKRPPPGGYVQTRKSGHESEVKKTKFQTA